jgi:hypothetical protein
MKRVQAVKQVGVRQALLLAGLVLASVGAQAAVLPKITVTGFIGNSVTAQDVALQYDPSPWFGKAYTLEMTVDAEGVVGTLEEDSLTPGLFFNHWTPNRVDYRLTIDGALVSSGSDTQWADVETINNFTLSSGIPNLPPEFQVGHTYDQYLVSMDGGVQFGCLDGVCDSPADTHELLRMTYEHFWDMAQGDAIISDTLPDLQSGAPDFTQGFGFVSIDFEQWNQATGSMGAGFIASSVTNVTVAAVPEPETYAMMLAGLGLVGFAARRRAEA